MESKRIHIFFRKYGALLISLAVVLAIVLLACLLGTKKQPNYELEINNQPWSSVQEVDAKKETFVLPLADCTITKDYSQNSLMENKTLNKWIAHKWVDLSSETSSSVVSVLDGTVLNVSYDYAKGNCVTIEHSGGFKSVYASLENVSVKAGDTVKKGDLLGKTSQSARNEIDLGNHLHFELYENDKVVDPNLYLDLSKK